jgi:deoxycytidylate deaminase
MCNLASQLADLSTCKREKVGCVIIPASLSGIAAISYNGPAKGRPNCSCKDQVGACGCAHAEANALIKVSQYYQGEELILISTTSPCEHCAALILNHPAHVAVVLYGKLYRTIEGLDALRESGIVILPIDTIHDITNIKEKSD